MISSPPDARSAPGAGVPETGLERCLARLDEAIDAAASLGVDVSGAASVRDTARQRLGFPGRAYVLALAGGTGVGKSSLLNELAGKVVSESGVRRPTTGEPVAWIPTSERADLAPLLAWLGIGAIREHAGSDLGSVAIIDLPDLDSITAANRARVDELLPRLDAVAWVADPEKYQDALLHDVYMRTWGPRLARQVVVLNKVDRVEGTDADRLRRDLARQLRAEGLPELPIALTTTRSGPDGTAELRRWLAEGVEAKQIVADRLRAEVRVATRELGARAGVAEDGSGAPLLEPRRREQAIGDVTRETLRIVDLAGLERQAVAATRLAARPRGGGPMGAITSRLYRWSGREQVAADPSGYLRRWRGRGSLARAVEPLRRLVSDTLPGLPAAARPALIAASEPAQLQERLTDAIDRAVAAPAATFKAPTSPIWWFIGIGQWLVSTVLLLTALWLVVLWVTPGTPVGRVDLPLLGPVPQPLVLLVAALALGFVLARLLGWHAGWLGRRWAGRLRRRMSEEIEGRLATGVFAPLEGLERARERLAAAVHAVARDCRAD